MPISSEDYNLIQGCVKGQKKSWDLFVAQYSRLIYWSIWKALENQAIKQKEEICQEVFQDFFKKILDSNCLSRLLLADNVKSYLRMMAYHHTFDILRKEIKKSQLERPVNSRDFESGCADTDNGIAGRVMKKEVSEILAPLISDLSARDRSCLELCYFDGRSHREIGILLNLPQDTVSTILRRIKEKLYLKLKDVGIFDAE